MEHPANLATFEAAFRAQAGYVAHVLGRLRVPSEAVGDAVQDVFVAAYRHWSDFDPDRPVRPWLTGFARRIAFRYRRSAARRQRRSAAWLHVVRDRQRPVSDEVEARDFLQRFLAQIDASHRRAFLMMELEGLSGPEAATALGISTEAVYGRVRSTRRRLKRALLVDGREPDPKVAALVPAWPMLRDELVPGISTVAVPTLGSTLKAVAATLALGFAGLTAVDIAWDRDEPTPATASISPLEPIEATDDRTVAIATVEPVPPHAPLPDPQIVHSGASRILTAAPSRPRPAKSDVPSVDGTAPNRSLAAETALLQASKSALTRGDAAAALGHLDAHARRFPSGQLADARRRSRIRALCDLGRTAQAQGEAHQLVRTRPDDPLAVEALSICQSTTIQKRPPPEK